MKKVNFIMMALIAMFLMGISGCETTKTELISDSGVKKTTAKVKTQSNGLTIEQENVKRRLEIENNPGSIKHLYVISSMSGQVILYSTVKGKVTSSGKRLTPTSITHTDWLGDNPIEIVIGNQSHHTLEVLQDDGTYGSSIPYLFWWDVQGRYHQHYVSGGQILHVSDQPIPVKNITINLSSE